MAPPHGENPGSATGGGSRGGVSGVPPYGPKFSQFHAVFEILIKLYVGAPSWRVGATSYGNTGSAPGLNDDSNLATDFSFICRIKAEHNHRGASGSTRNPGGCDTGRSFRSRN